MERQGLDQIAGCGGYGYVEVPDFFPLYRDFAADISSNNRVFY
jgi:hypothetical protein